MSGFTTTPEERLGPGPPYTTPSLQANLFFRVFLGILAPMASWVPMKLLWRNGEFAAATLYMVTTILNIYYVVNALLWRNDNVQEWYAGYGWCDLQIYTVFALETIYSACIFAIMRNLANRLGLVRATSLSAGEKKRRNLIESLIMFPVALVQIILTYFVLAQRYNVSTLIGCTSAYDESWPLVFFLLPSPIYAFGAACYAILAWKRFRDVNRATRMAMNTNNSTMAQRHQRMRRKLYFMTLSILVPFFPIELLFLAYNLLSLNLPLKPYDFYQIHHGNNPFPFEFISFTTSDLVGFVDLNSNYMPVITVIPLFWFFGTTKEAINIYREYLLALGLGRWFPKLHDEYDPDRSSSTGMSWRQSLSKVLRSSTRTTSSRSSKDPVLPTAHHISLASSSTTTRKSSDAPGPTSTNPWPDAPPPSRAPAGGDDDDHVHELRARSRNPFIFRTALSRPIRFPPLRIPSLRRKAAAEVADEPSSPGTLLRPLSMPSDNRPETGSTAAGPTWARGSVDGAAKVHTRVWSEETSGGGVAMAPEHEAKTAGVKIETQIASSTEEAVGRAV